MHNVMTKRKDQENDSEEDKVEEHSDIPCFCNRDKWAHKVN